MSLNVFWFKAQKPIHIVRFTFFLRTKKIKSLYWHELGQIYPFLSNISSCLHTYACSEGKRQTCLDFVGLVVLSIRCISCVMWFASGKIGSAKTSTYLWSKSITAWLLEPGATGGATPWSPCPGPLLAPIASRYLQGSEKSQPSRTIWLAQS